MKGFNLPMGSREGNEALNAARAMKNGGEGSISRAAWAEMIEVAKVQQNNPELDPVARQNMQKMAQGILPPNLRLKE